MKLRKRYGGRRWLPGIESSSDFGKIASHSKVRHGQAVIYDHGGRCMAIARYERAGLFFCRIFIGDYQQPLSIIACPGEDTIYSKECGDDVDILDAYANAESE